MYGQDRAGKSSFPAGPREAPAPLREGSRFGGLIWDVGFEVWGEEWRVQGVGPQEAFATLRSRRAVWVGESHTRKQTSATLNPNPKYQSQ